MKDIWWEVTDIISAMTEYYNKFSKNGNGASYFGRPMQSDSSAPNFEIGSVISIEAMFKLSFPGYSIPLMENCVPKVNDYIYLTIVNPDSDSIGWIAKVKSVDNGYVRYAPSYSDRNDCSIHASLQNVYFLVIDREFIDIIGWNKNKDKAKSNEDACPICGGRLSNRLGAPYCSYCHKINMVDDWGRLTGNWIEPL